MIGLVAVVLVVLTGAAAFAAFQVQRARNAAARLRAAEERADRAVRARDAFFDLATHELRSPLAAILGYQELLEDGAYGRLDDAAVEPVSRIGRSARHLLHLIDGVVELSRLRSGGVRPELERVNTGVLISGVADAFRTHARDRGTEPVVSIDPDLPVITSDPDRLLRALDLLVTSAVKHPAGRDLRFDAASTGDDLVVRIHPTELNLRNEGDDPELRLGIRLAVAGRVAELLGGDLELEVEDPAEDRDLQDEHGPRPARPGSITGTITGIRFRVRDLTPANP